MSIFQNADSTVVAQQRDHLVTTTGWPWCSPPSAPTRWRAGLPGQSSILAPVLSITTFPAIAIAAPLFSLWSDIGIYNTLIGLIIPNLTFALPLAIYILASFFKEIPKDLEEAALVDGATTSPLRSSGAARGTGPRHGGIPTFIATWNEFLWRLR